MTLLTILRLYVALIGTLILFISKGVYNSTISIGQSLNLGLGAIDQALLLFGEDSELDIGAIALLVNLPQIGISMLYFLYNSFYSSMLTSYEWVSYAHKRKGLRVSCKPKGAQRSTYFLSIPYRFGVPLVALSATLHWLVSQTIFIVAIDVFAKDGSKSITRRTCGWSPLGLMLTIIVLGLMLLTILCCTGLVYKSGMPLAGVSSLAISAACHSRDQYRLEERLVSQRELKWGVIETSVDGVGRCAFSSREVAPLVKGNLYK